MYWNGWNGSRWSLVNPTQGSVMLPGVRGLSMPPVTHYADTYASVAGSAWRGYNVGEREVFWPIQIFSNASSQEWIDRDSAWWRTMRPGKTGTWEVIQPNGTKRTLRLRFKDDGTQQFDLDPVMTGWANYGITLVAAQPFWEGETLTRKFSGGTVVPFYEPPATGKVVSISKAGVASTKLRNPGDEPAWPTWYITGPATAFTVGYGSRLISGNVTVGVGQTLTIVTDPTKRSATVDGTDVMGQLTQKDFAPFPEGDLIGVTANVTGTGKASYSMTPLYHRAW